MFYTNVSFGLKFYDLGMAGQIYFRSQHVGFRNQVDIKFLLNKNELIL